MTNYFFKSIFLLFSLVIIVCGFYPLVLCLIAQSAFPFQANGSLLFTPDNKSIGSRLIAQPFTKQEYFQPRPSAAAYDASASTSSSLAASNYALRDRIGRVLGPILRYRDGRPVGPDVEKWFQQNKFQGKSNIVELWATLHPTSAQAWVRANPKHAAYVVDWAKQHPNIVAEFIKRHPSLPNPTAIDLAQTFFQRTAKDNPGKFPVLVSRRAVNGKSATTFEWVNTGTAIQSIFFDLWREDHPEADLQDIPGDLVTTSASGLDPHITLQNAEYQLDRVAVAWAERLNRDENEVRKEIVQILQLNSRSPLGGLAGEKLVNVLEVNLELYKRYGSPD